MGKEKDIAMVNLADGRNIKKIRTGGFENTCKWSWQEDEEQTSPEEYMNNDIMAVGGEEVCRNVDCRLVRENR